MAQADAAIYAAIGDVAVIAGESVPGVFTDRSEDVQIGEGAVVEIRQLTFGCRYSSLIAGLQAEDPLEIMVDGTSRGLFRLLRRVPPEGDDSGHVVLELGTLPTGAAV